VLDATVSTSGLVSKLDATVSTNDAWKVVSKDKRQVVSKETSRNNSKFKRKIGVWSFGRGGRVGGRVGGPVGGPVAAN